MLARHNSAGGTELCSDAYAKIDGSTTTEPGLQLLLMPQTEMSAVFLSDKY